MQNTQHTLERTYTHILTKSEGFYVWNLFAQKSWECATNLSIIRCNRIDCGVKCHIQTESTFKCTQMYHDGLKRPKWIKMDHNELILAKTNYS